MDTKSAAANSLYIILFSQAASFLATMASRSIPEFSAATLALMTLGGIGGGIAGRKINNKLGNKSVERLFVCLMCVIILVSVCNAWKYAN